MLSHGASNGISYQHVLSYNPVFIRALYSLTFAEFILKKYLRDRDGNWINEILDGNDHSIDAVRYAMMGDVLRD